MGFPGGSEGEVSAYNMGDPGSIPGLGRSPGEGNGYPLQYSCLENSMDRGAWWSMGSQRIKVTNTFTFTVFILLILSNLKTALTPSASRHCFYSAGN